MSSGCGVPADPPGQPADQRRGEPDEPLAVEERRRRRARVFGDVLPDSTGDERGDGWGDPEPGSNGRDPGEEWLRGQVPPHHG
jgi:hypothetical protein